MKYMCKTCKKTCDDIIQHIRKVHGFSESHIKEDQNKHKQLQKFF